MPTPGGALQEGAATPPVGLIDVRDGAQIESDWRLSVKSRHTQDAYAGDLRQFYDWCLTERVDPARFSRADGDRYRDWLAGPQPGGRNGRYGRATVARKLTAVSSFYRYVSQERPDVIAVNPWDRVTRPRVSTKSHTRHLSLEETDRLLDAAADHSPAAYALVDLMLTTGVRTTEVIHASVTDFYRDGDDSILRVTRKGDEEDDVFVPVETATAIREYLDGRTSGPLFVLPSTGGRPLRRQQVQTLIAGLAKSAGLTATGEERNVSPHSLRHTAATHAFDQPDIDTRKVQHMMGHRDPRTTNRYDGGAVEAGRAAARSLGRLWHRDRSEGGSS